MIYMLYIQELLAHVLIGLEAYFRGKSSLKGGLQTTFQAATD
jgi:hypothetical protein